MLGFTRSEFEAGRIRWDERTPPEHLPADWRAIAELRERGVCTPYEKEYLRKDGSRVWVLLTDAVLPGPDEQILAIVVDISERKRAEEEARRLLDEVEASRRVLLSVVEDQKQAEAEVRRLNAELEQRVRDRTARAGGRQRRAGGVQLLRLPRPARAAARHQRLRAHPDRGPRPPGSTPRAGACWTSCAPRPCAWAS